MSPADPILVTSGLSKRYRHRWALQDCSLELPRGSLAALVGPNGAGKSTLLRIVAGLTRSNAGSFEILGSPPGSPSTIAYLDQDRPLYRGFSVAETLRLGRELNGDWDQERARRHIEQLDIPMSQEVRALSGGQRAQVALTLCLARHPNLLLLDEPFAGVDPLARGDLVGLLLQSVVDDGTTVLLSSHAIAELADFCDHLILLTAARVRLSGEIEQLVARHRLLVGDAGRPVPPDARVVAAATTGRQLSVIVEADPLARLEDWEVAAPSLEEVVVAYLREDAGERRSARLPGTYAEIRPR